MIPNHRSGALSPALALMLVGGALCNDAVTGGTTRMTRAISTAVGDPTEGALVIAAAKAGLWKEELLKTMPRIAELPFDLGSQAHDHGPYCDLQPANPAYSVPARSSGWKPSAPFLSIHQRLGGWLAGYLDVRCGWMTQLSCSGCRLARADRSSQRGYGQKRDARSGHWLPLL